MFLLAFFSHHVENTLRLFCWRVRNRNIESSSPSFPRQSQHRSTATQTCGQYQTRLGPCQPPQRSKQFIVYATAILGVLILVVLVFFVFVIVMKPYNVNGYHSNNTHAKLQCLFYLCASSFFQKVANLILLNHEYSIKELGSN